MTTHVADEQNWKANGLEEKHGLSLSLRLSLWLAILIGAAMTLGGWYILRQRVAILENATRNELRAHAVMLQIALEDAFRNGRDAATLQRLIDRLSENPRVYSIIIVDERGQVTNSSKPTMPAALRVAPEMVTGETVELTKEMDLFSIIMPIRLVTGERAAFELAQPTSFIVADRAQARRDIVLIALLLCLVVIVLVLAIMRYNVLRPLQELLQGTTAIGASSFDYRVTVPPGGHELTRLARAFNQMAAQLAAQRDTAERAAAHELELERKLRQSERLAVVGRMAAGVAHELGAPLNVIKGRVGMVQAGAAQLTEKQQRNLTIINAQADAITHLVRQLLNLAQPFQLQPELLNLRELVTGVCELIEAEAEKHGVRIELPPDEHAWVTGDRKLLHQALLNLCLNGVQAMEAQSGTLQLTIERNANDASAYTLLRIADSGPGIAPEHLEHIFDPFFTTKEVGKGTGLGLSVSRRIIEKHGGRIEAANRAQGGAVFLLWLPSAVISHNGATE